MKKNYWMPKKKRSFMIRGAVVTNPRYDGRRVFGAGVNLTHLYGGQVDFMFFVTRDLGYVNKLFRGLSSGSGARASRRRRPRSFGSPQSRRSRSAARASSCTRPTT